MLIRSSARLALALALVPLFALSVACTGDDDDDDPGSCTTGGSGDLTIQASTPSGTAVTPSIVIVRPDRTTVEIAASSMMTGVPAGVYTVAARTDAIAPDGVLAGSIYGVLDSIRTVCVPADGEVTVSLDYVLLASGTSLWAASGETAASIGIGSLTGTVTANPDLRIDVRLVNDFRGAVFDRFGDLWLATGTTYGSRLLALTTAEASMNGDDLTPAHGLSTASFGSNPGRGLRPIALDGQGRLWILDAGNDQSDVFAYDELQLIEAMSAEAPVEIAPARSIAVTDLDNPGALAFDATGNLWITDNAASRLLKIDAADLTTSGAAIPSVMLTASTPAPVIGEIRGPTDLAFDRDGSLWVLYDTANMVVHFSASDLTTSGDVVIGPERRVVLDVTTLPSGLAFDGEGGLWVGANRNRFIRIDPSTGAVDYTVTAPATDEPAALWFYPPPASLPLR